MAKTREIDVLVEPIFVNTNLYNGMILKMNDDNPHMIKAKLIITLPEKKVTITESEFTEAFFEGHNTYDGRWADEIRRAKEKLFARTE